MSSPVNTPEDPDVVEAVAELSDAVDDAGVSIPVIEPETVVAPPEKLLRMTKKQALIQAFMEKEKHALVRPLSSASKLQRMNFEQLTVKFAEIPKEPPSDGTTSENPVLTKPTPPRASKKVASATPASTPREGTASASTSDKKEIENLRALLAAARVDKPKPAPAPAAIDSPPVKKGPTKMKL